MKSLFNPSHILFCTVLLFSISCGESDSNNENGNNGHGTNNGHGDEVELEFAMQVDGKDLDCSSDYTLGTQSTKSKLADARFFVSSIEYRNTSGEWLEMELSSNKWQYKNLALLDFEDATGACSDSGTPEMYKIVNGTLPPGNYDKVRFSLGVPFELNHIDNASATAPLDTPGMYWVWRGGYKFLKIDWKVEGSAIPRYNTHLGSTGCKSTTPTTPPEKACSNPNLATLEFDITSQIHNIVTLDLKKMLAETDLNVNVMDTPPGCQSSPMESSDCEKIFSALGMDFSTGKCSGHCSGQTAFSLITHH